MASLRDRLRSLPVMSLATPDFDTDAAPGDPLELLADWLEAAIAAGVSAPHAMTLSTAAASGAVSARTLLLKDLTADGLWFATLATSPKGRDLVADPRCALVLYWREQSRQVRVEGVARPGPREVGRADFLARHPTARAGAIAGPTSQPIVDEPAARARALRTIGDDPEFVPEAWSAYVVEPTMIEFWQSTADREQLRLRYRREDHGWTREKIWP